VSKKLFVVELQNNRVVRFSSAAALTTGAAAEAVLGQPDFATTTVGITQSKMSNPADISVDAAGRLWVADYNNHRVLRFDNAASKASGANADGVLGQTDFITRTTGAGANKMWSPASVFADSSGRLWVADINNNRVLRFDNAAAKANGASADAVLGQTDFATVTSGTGANKMNNPAGVALDTGGRLYVADANNNRILRFDAAATKANGANADAVFGQPDFATVTSGTTQSKFKLPQGIATDANNRLYVADFSNSRVLIFNNAGTAANGALASVVLGQPDFTTGTQNTGGVSAVSMNNPVSKSLDESSSSLFVADYGNNRVLRFAAPASPTAATVSISGYVTTSSGRGIVNVRMSLTDSNGQVRTVTTTSFGYYRFDDVQAGETYILSATGKHYTFSQPLQVLNINEETNEVNFTANSEKRLRVF
jgi:sugar lactone lactonase YvrE